MVGQEIRRVCNCGLVPQTGRSCDSCKEKSLEKYRNRVAEDLCRDCGIPNTVGQTRCPNCLFKRSNRRKVKHQKLQSNNLCVGCASQVPLNNKRLCRDCKDKDAKIQLASRRRLRQQIISAYGGACNCCGVTIPEWLQIDHINNDGAEHRKALKSTRTTIYAWLRRNNYPKDNFQLLCGGCHHAKTCNGKCECQTKYKLRWVIDEPKAVTGDENVRVQK